MNKRLRHLSLFLMVLIISALAISSSVYASPGLTPLAFISRPTANVVTGTVTTPANAYDSNNDTSAKMQFDTAGNSLEVKTFSTSGAPTTQEIGIVDIKIRYSAEAGGSASEQYYIDYYVGTSGPVTLQASTSAAYTLATREWLAVTEPIDGVWSWTDINSLRVIFHSTTGSGKASYIYPYEVWLHVFSYRKPTVSVTLPAGTLTAPFNVTIDIATFDDLYGWEFKLYYNTAILTATKVYLAKPSPPNTWPGGALPLLNSTVGTANTWGLIKEISDTYNSTHGRVWAAQTILGDRYGATGTSGTLACVQFSIDTGTGESSFQRLRDVKLSGYEKNYGKRVLLMTCTTVDFTPILEFPFGLAMEIGLGVAIIYIFYRTRRKTKTPNISTAPPQIRYN